MRFFNTEGPIRPEKHYCVPALERLDMDEVLRLVRDDRYFVLHAPRQTGKTSVLIALQHLLNGQGYHCLYATVEEAGAADVERVVLTVLDSLAHEAQDELGDPFLASVWPGVLADSGPDRALRVSLERWARASPKPLVLLIDEIDTLQGASLLSVLRQLRAGYRKRPEAFPQSVVLCGMRDMRDYRIESTGSPFNIAAKSLRLGDFTREETLALLGQHTAETGQAFTPEAQETVWEQTQGQPWLVNALAREACFESETGRDRSHAVTAGDIADAREELIQRRVTHLDQLAYRLRQDRVRRVIEPLLSGSEIRRFQDNDIQYVRDLGLLATEPPYRIANPIYAEVVPRQLTWVVQGELEHDTAWYVSADGALDVPKLMAAFQAFFRENSEHWKERFEYQEAWPQLLLQAFLQRVLNGGGRIEREYGLGRGRVDLLIVWPQGGRLCNFVVECKVLRKSLETTIAEGLKQIAGYMDRCAAESGHLVIFDSDEKKSWEEKVFRRRLQRNIEVWGM